MRDRSPAPSAAMILMAATSFNPVAKARRSPSGDHAGETPGVKNWQLPPLPSQTQISAGPDMVVLMVLKAILLPSGE